MSGQSSPVKAQPSKHVSTPRPAAAYVRMSTEHQQYSTENQLAVICAYAVEHDMELVRTYTDDAKSGLR